MAESASESIEERLLTRGALFAAMVGLPLALLAAYPITLGLFLGVLLSRGRIKLLAVVVVAYGLAAYLRGGNALSADGFVDYAASQAQGMGNLALGAVSLVWEYREAPAELLAHLAPVLADSRALSVACVPLLCLSVPLGVLLGVGVRRRRRGKTAAGEPTKAGASTAAPRDRPPSTVHTPHGLSPRRAEAIWTPDGGLPPGLGEGPVTRYVVDAPWRFRIRYRVAQLGIFGRVGPPRYRVLHAKGGVGGLFTRFRSSSIHGNEDLHGTDTQFWAPSYTVTEPTRFHRVRHAYQVAHAAVYRYQVGQASVYTNAASQTRLRLGTRAGTLAPIGAIATIDHTTIGVPCHPHTMDTPPVPTLPAPPSPGSWGPDGQLGSVTTLMAPPKTGKTRLDVDVHAAIISGGMALGWQAGLSGVLWLVEESESVFRGKRSETIRIALAATGSTPTSTADAVPPGINDVAPGATSTAGGALPPLAERLVCLYGPGRPVGLPQLAVYLAEAIQAARILESRYGIPYRAITVDSLFFWVPDAETDATTAGRCMALFKSAAALGYAIRVRTHADPESGRQKGPMRLWSQTDYRVALTPEPRKTPPESTPNRRLVFTGRYDDGERPPDVLYTLTDAGLSLLPGRSAAARLSHLATGPDKPAPIAPPQVPQAEARFLAALPPEGAALTDLEVPGWSRSMVYKVASDLRKSGVLVESKGKRGKLTLIRAQGNHSAATNGPPEPERFAAAE